MFFTVTSVSEAGVSFLQNVFAKGHRGFDREEGSYWSLWLGIPLAVLDVFHWSRG